MQGHTLTLFLFFTTADSEKLVRAGIQFKVLYVCMHIQRLSANRYSKHTLMALHILREAVGGDKHGALSISHTHTLSRSLEELEVEKFVSTVCFYLLINFIFSLTPQILEYCF